MKKLIISFIFVMYFALTLDACMHIVDSGELASFEPIGTETPHIQSSMPTRPISLMIMSTEAPTATPSPCDVEHSWIDEDLHCSWCKEYISPRYGFTEDDIYLLAQLLCGDASIDGDGEYDFVQDDNYCEMSKVLCTVMNRVRSDEYPDTVKEVVLQPGHFIVFPKNIDTVPDEIAVNRIREWCNIYDRWYTGIQSIPEDHLYFTGDGITNHTRSEF